VTRHNTKAMPPALEAHGCKSCALPAALFWRPCQVRGGSIPMVACWNGETILALACPALDMERNKEVLRRNGGKIHGVKR